MRGLIDTIRLVPQDGSLSIELYGELSALLALCVDTTRKHPRGATAGVTGDAQIKLVAGVGFEHTTFRL